MVRGGLYVYTLVFQASPLSPAHSTPLQLKSSHYACGNTTQEIHTYMYVPNCSYKLYLKVKLTCFAARVRAEATAILLSPMKDTNNRASLAESSLIS